MNLKKSFKVFTLLLACCLTSLAQIEAGKAIQITISGVPAEEKGRVDGIYPVSDAGFINMPFIDTVRAAGLRNEDLAASLQNRYKSLGIYTNPTIQVISKTGDSIDEQMVHLGGQVRGPGPKPFRKGLTLYQAVQAAGGATEFGSMKRVKLFRNGRQTLYNLTKAEFMSVPLEPNDTIEVPQKDMFGN
jgi:protein involved in polysaccharide export with SLBB domain